MSNFDNECYKSLISDIIGDAFYNGKSYRGKISEIRKYAEVLVRKILNIGPNKKVTIGDYNIKEQLSQLPNSQFLMESINVLQRYGNQTTHTQYVGEVTIEDFEKCTDAVFNIIAFIFINYFEKHKFGSNNLIMRLFSLLPPIIRVLVLDYLFSKEQTNVDVIDRLVLAHLKTYGYDEAEKWIYDHADLLSSIKPFNEDTVRSLIEQLGEINANIILGSAQQDMFYACIKKITDLKNQISKSGPLYTNFENALPYYIQEKQSEVYDFDEAKELIDLMDFVYTGRMKDESNQLPPENFLILNFFGI